MAQITNSELKQLLDALTTRVGNMENRMNTYEQQAIANGKTLAEIRTGVTLIKGSFRVLRWAAIAITSAALWQVGQGLFHLLAGR